MRDKLPHFVLRRKKEGFDIPAHAWLRGVLKPLLLDILTRETVEKSNLFDWNAVESVIRRHLDRRANLGYHLWGLLTLFLWMKRWGIQSSPVDPATAAIAAVTAVALFGSPALRAQPASPAVAHIENYYKEMMPTIRQAGRLSVRERRIDLLVPEVELARRLIFFDKSQGDPLQAYMRHFSGKQAKPQEAAVHAEQLSVEDRLKFCIINGEKAVGDATHRQTLEQILE